MFWSAVQRAAYSSTWIEFIQTCVLQCLKRLWRCCRRRRRRWCRLLFGWVLIEWCHWQAPSISHHAVACASCTLGTKLFVFISIQCFFNVFISKVPSCVCQPQWKARDTTERGSRFNRFHAICAALRGICLPLGEGRLSHSGGFSRAAGTSPTLPVLRTEGTDAAGFCSKIFLILHLCTPAARILCFSTWRPAANEVQMRWSAIYPFRCCVVCSSVHARTSRVAIMIINMSVLYFLRGTFMKSVKRFGPLQILCFNLMWLALVVPTKVILLYCKHVISNSNYFQPQTGGQGVWGDNTHSRTHTRVFTGELLRAYELLQAPQFMT